MEGMVFRALWMWVVAIFQIIFAIFRMLWVIGVRMKGVQAEQKKEFFLPVDARFAHTHIVAGTGHGKTQLIQRMLLDDIDSLREGKASVIVIDSQGDLIKNISHLASMNALKEQIIIIDPTDIAHPPCLNLFDFGLDRLEKYSLPEREILVNGTIAMYEYVFGALLGAALTNRQRVIFRYLARLMTTVPDATINTLIDFMIEPERVRPYIPALDPIYQKFFETEFFSKDFDDTRQQIRTRLWGMMADATLAKMFGHTRNKLNLFDAMNRGSIILINTAKEQLKQEGCEILGRFFIALICQAAQERASIPEEKRKHTFVYIDEAYDYFDESMGSLLETARKYKVGLVIAHQNLGQFERKLHKTVMANTAIKMVGGLSVDDAKDFAPEMRCEPEFLLGMEKDHRRTQFAYYIKNHTPKAAGIGIIFGEMERKPRLTDSDYEMLRDRNRQRYCDTSPAKLPSAETPAVKTGFTLGKQETL